MKIALASPPVPASLKEALKNAETLVRQAAAEEAKIVCFPESYLPGYTGMGAGDEDRTPGALTYALNQVCSWAAQEKIAVLMPMDWHAPEGFMNVVQVISPDGKQLGYQSKNQLDPSEDQTWIPGTARHIFETAGLKFGITICHEGFRYPESVRWAARADAQIVFHPHFAGSDTEGITPGQWGSMQSPYYEKAMMMRALENTIYFASSNYATRYPESASSIIAPDGALIAHQPYARPGILVADIDLSKATGYLAKRFRPELYSSNT